VGSRIDHIAGDIFRISHWSPESGALLRPIARLMGYRPFEVAQSNSAFGMVPDTEATT
jgi:hypothetical protein